MNHLEKAAQYLEHCRNMIFRLSSVYGLESDDLFQDMYLFIVDLLQRKQKSTENERAYVYACVRYQITNRVIARADRPPCLSLERVIPGTTTTLGETVAAPSATLENTVTIAHHLRDVLYQALWDATLNQQKALRDYFLLSDFEPRAPARPDTSNSSTKTLDGGRSLRSKAYRALRANRELCKEVLALKDQEDCSPIVKRYPGKPLERVATLLAENPAMSNHQLATVAHVSYVEAKQYRNQVMAFA